MFSRKTSVLKRRVLSKMSGNRDRKSPPTALFMPSEGFFVHPCFHSGRLLSVSAAAARAVRKRREGSGQRAVPLSGFRAGRLRPHILAGASALSRSSSLFPVPAGVFPAPAGGVCIGIAAAGWTLAGCAFAGRTAAVSVLTAAAIASAVAAPAFVSIVPASAAVSVTFSAATA